MLKLVERHLHWLPYLTIALLVAAEVRLADDARAGGLAAALSDRGVVLLVLGLVLLAPQLILCSRRATRVKATAALLVAVLLTAVVFTTLELLLPPVGRFPDWQLALQAQLARRDTRTVKPYRGLELVEDANGLGWIDRPRDIGAGRPVVFIGDSFLESVTTKPLARRVEERLQDLDEPVDVVNLSKADTDPQHDYRLRLHELVRDYRPRHVYVFLYAGNDLSDSYRYAPYQHPEYRVTTTAIARLETAGLAATALERLGTLARSSRVLTSREDLDETLRPVLADAGPRQLAYLTCMAWTRPIGPGLCRRLWPETIQRLGTVWDKADAARKSLRRRLRARTTGCARRPWDEFHEQYESIVDLPREERLEQIATVIASRYCGAEDVEPFLSTLRKLPASFTDRLVEEPWPGLLMESLARAVAGEKVVAEADEADARGTAEAYLELMQEFAATVREMGAGFTVVLIPVAGYADDGYRRFWAPLIDTAARYHDRRVTQQATAARLDGAVDLVDLLDHADRFEDGYWKFDGHWNEQGNDAAAAILAEHVRGAIGD